MASSATSQSPELCAARPGRAAAPGLYPPGGSFSPYLLGKLNFQTSSLPAQFWFRKGLLQEVVLEVGQDTPERLRPGHVHLGRLISASLAVKTHGENMCLVLRKRGQGSRWGGEPEGPVAGRGQDLGAEVIFKGGVRDEGGTGKQMEENQQRWDLEADRENFKKEQLVVSDTADLQEVDVGCLAASLARCPLDASSSPSPP
ncbi:hypothetical protein Cadr_000014358 [Camelus dromedarius]|uniref:Uncharacterized protein n=1 Tax=Camelus dromedarius TaxID=9838 RepID=A0A5N4DLW0_CAMDR|nr:hypothetical protein Cadr_000014358 [Camelus dromedarius]